MERTERDYLTVLPIEVKAMILSQLPICQAVQTCILSRQWRHTWTFITSLHLGNNLSSSSMHRSAQYWINAARQLLRSHHGPIHSFSFGASFHSKHRQYFGHILSLLAKRGPLYKLVLYDYGSNHFPLKLYPFGSLNTLELYGCQVNLPEGFMGFECLQVLHLDNVNMSRIATENLISRSKSLRFLYIALHSNEETGEPFDPETVFIHSASLEDLALSVDDNSAKVRAVSVPCLENISIELHNFVSEAREELGLYLIELLKDIAGVKALDISENAFRCLYSIKLQIELARPILGIEKLTLWMKNSDATACTAIVYLMKSSPNLNYLSFQIENDGEYEPVLDQDPQLSDENFLTQNYFSCLDSSLSDVYIWGLDVKNRPLLHLLRYILQNARVLKEMEIVCYLEPEFLDIYHEAKLDMEDERLELPAAARELSQIKRASPDCKLNIKFRVRKEQT